VYVINHSFSSRTKGESHRKQFRIVNVIDIRRNLKRCATHHSQFDCHSLDPTIRGAQTLQPNCVDYLIKVVVAQNDDLITYARE
jgi:hypothetical protein